MPQGETLNSLKGKVFLYCEALSNLTSCATDDSLKSALVKFKFFPTVSELSEFFIDWRQSDPNWKPPKGEFEAPHELASLFEAWRDAIGVAAYRSWLRGAQAWIGTDKSIHIQASSPVKARWIRENYVSALEAKAQSPVVVFSRT
jgi:hypothetical protein